MRSFSLATFFFLTLFTSLSLAQQPAKEYTELSCRPQKDANAWNQVNNKVNISWGTTDVRYNRYTPPAPKELKSKITLQAWRGERVSAQAVVWSKEPIANLTYTVTDFKGKNGLIKANDAVLSGFSRYVMTDELNKTGSGTCGHRPDPSLWDSSLVADVIDHHQKELSLEAKTTQGIWVRVWVPESTTKGVYSGAVMIKDGEKVIGVLPLNIEVSQRILPQPNAWNFHLDLWQNPYAEARFFGVTPWSKEHLECMRPTMQLLADAGQKTITTTLMHKPWGGQTYDPFDSMVTWIKRADGTWFFDFTVFDIWVEYMMGLGIDKQINCYSMIPWKLNFRYLDQATQSFKTIDATPGEAVYNEVWGELLRQFATHLKSKGWFEKTMIAMDERPKKQMKIVLDLIKSIDKDYKISLAGEYHEELESSLDDYCVASCFRVDPTVVARRRAENKSTTYYTCCAESYPNGFTFSSPAESEWIAWYAAAAGFDGYLRWAYNSYTKTPLLDSRFRSWGAGDTYQAYPDGRSSMRMERLVEGIQAYEKIVLLKAEFTQTGNKAGLKKISEILKSFSIDNFPKIAAQTTVNKAKMMLNKL